MIESTSDVSDGTYRSGFVALVGAPNAGKSTLLNQLIGAKVSIVTHKVQTTRAMIRGISTDEASQIVFVDTPGIFSPKRRLDEAMVSTAWGSAREADIICYLLDAQRGLSDEIRDQLQKLREMEIARVLLLNKIDLIRRDQLLALTAQVNEILAFDETFMISAVTGDGCQDLLTFLRSKLPFGPQYYPDDQISDFPMRQMAAEITREKLYLRLHQGLPYASHVETEGWEEQKDGSVKISQVIYVERGSQKKIVIGRNGSAIKAISQAARREIGDILEQKVHLFLFVKVREHWGNDPERYREMGLDFPAG